MMVKAKVKATATAEAKAKAQTKTDSKRSARNRELAQALEKSIEPTQNATRPEDDDQVQVALTGENGRWLKAAHSNALHTVDSDIRMINR